MPRLIVALWLALLAWPAATHAEVLAPPGTRIENLSAQLRQAGVWLAAAPDFAVAGERIWLLDGEQQIVDLASGVRVLPRGFVAHSFARTRDGSVVVITENVLGGYFRGLFLPATRLPFGNMRVVPGPGESVLVFGGPDDRQLLIRYDGARYATLLALDEPIGAVAHAGERILVAAGAKLLSVRSGEPPALAYMLPDGAPITGLAVDAAAGVIYLATADSIVALRGGLGTRLVRGLGGRLQWDAGKLYVLDARAGLFVRLTLPASTPGVTGAAPAPGVTAAPSATADPR